MEGLLTTFSWDLTALTWPPGTSRNAETKRAAPWLGCQKQLLCGLFAAWSHRGKVLRVGQTGAQGMRELSQRVCVVVLPLTSLVKDTQAFCILPFQIRPSLGESEDTEREERRVIFLKYCPRWRGADRNSLVFYWKHEKERQRSVFIP